MSISNLLTDHRKAYQNLKVNDLSTAKSLRQHSSLFPSTDGMPVLSSYFHQIDDVVINTLAETSMIGSGSTGSTTTIPANKLEIGTTFLVRTTGTINVPAARSPTYRFKLNGTTVHSDVLTLAAATTGTVPFEMTTIYTTRSVGVGGSAKFHTWFSTELGAILMGDQTIGSIAIDTTIDNTIDMSWQWATLPADITTSIMTIRNE